MLEKTNPKPHWTALPRRFLCLFLIIGITTTTLPLFGQMASIDSLAQLPKTATTKEKILLDADSNPGMFTGYPFKGEYFHKKEDAQTRTFSINPITQHDLYIDLNGTTNIEDILAQQETLPWNNATALKHKKNTVYWMRTRFYGSPYFNGEQILNISTLGGKDIFTSHFIDSYISDGRGGYQHQRTGNRVPLKERAYEHWANFIKLDIGLTDTLDLFLRIEGADAQYLLPSIEDTKIFLWHVDPLSLFASQSNYAFEEGIFFGLLGVQCIFFFLLFLIEKERTHFYYAILILGFFIMSASDAPNPFAYVAFPTFNNAYIYAFPAGIFLLTLGWLKFVESYFNYSKSSVYRKWIVPIALTLSALICINFSSQFQFFDEESNTNLLLLYYNVLLGNLMILAIIGGIGVYKAPKQKNASKSFIALAFSPIGVTGILSLIVNIFAIELSFINLAIWMECSIVAMLILLSLSIGYRTNRIKAEKEAHKAQKNYLEKLDKTKTQFFTNISHEFRTPLTIISGMSTQIKENPKELLDNGLTMIQRNSDQLLHLVNQLLDLGKLEGGKMRLTYQQGDIIAYLKYLIESVHSLAANRQILLHFHAEEEQVLMDFDEEKIRQIFINLLSNAIKFTPNNGHVYVSVHTVNTGKEVIDFPHNEALKIVVRDTGSGIPADQLPFIFNRFYQVDGTSTRQGEGSGIGLALVKELMTLLQGTISVKSKFQKETTFTLLLPMTNEAPEVKESIVQAPIMLSKNPPTNEEKLPKLNGAESINPSKQRILVVEDNVDVVTYIALCLQPHFDVQIASNGQEGIEMALENIPDILITDVMMPLKDGFEVCQTLKKDIRTSHIPIIMLTAKVDIDSKLQGLEQGADAYLSKPFHPKELLIRLEQLIANRQRIQAKYRSAQLIKAPVPKTEDVFLQTIQKIIIENIENEAFDAAKLVQILGTSRTQLYRKLKALTDMSVANYINKIKLHEAKRLLIETDKNISEIAYAVGYTSLSYFSNSFSKAFGVSPRKFREQVNFPS